MDKLKSNLIFPGMVYTDTGGVVVFANQQFIGMLSISASRSPVGRPLWEVLQVDQASLSPLLTPQGRHARQPLILVYQRADGEQAIFLLVGTPSFDQRDQYIGMNVGVDDIDSVTGLDGVPSIHVAGQTLPMRRHVDEPSKRDPSMNGQYLEAVLNTIQVMLARMAGPRVREALVTSLDQAATRSDWPLHAESKHLVIERQDIPVDIGVGVINEALNFAVAVVGQRVIVYEIEELYAQLDADLANHALESGLSVPLIKHLTT